MIGLLARGLVGSLVLTGLHQGLAKLTPWAPRMDILGERAIKKGMKALGMKPPRGKKLYRLTMAGDLLSNGLVYAFVGRGSLKKRLVRGALIGAANGIGGAELPQRMGLGWWPSARSKRTKLMTVALYTAGGIASALAATPFRARTA